MRSLSPDEAALWARVASTIRPLSREKNEAAVAATAIEKARRPSVPQLSVRENSPKGQPGAGTTLDGSWDKRLRSGAVEPDRIVDLHGLSLDRAWDAIDRALEQAIAQGQRTLLLITGHHRSGEPRIRRGAIRAAVHDWLAASRHSVAIAAVRPAHRRHGGGGSLYIVLRRSRTRR